MNAFIDALNDENLITALGLLLLLILVFYALRAVNKSVAEKAQRYHDVREAFNKEIREQTLIANSVWEDVRCGRLRLPHADRSGMCKMMQDEARKRLMEEGHMPLDEVLERMPLCYRVEP